MRSFIRTLLAAALLSASIAQAAVQVGGVDFQPELGAQKGMLALNGAGLRTRVGFKVYAMGLYLRAPLTDAAAIIGDKGEKRIRIVLTRDLEAKQFGDALLAGLEKNHEPDELAALKPAPDALLGRWRQSARLRPAPRSCSTSSPTAPHAWSSMASNRATTSPT